MLRSSMRIEDTSAAAIKLLKERSRDALIAELKGTLVKLGQQDPMEAVVEFLADLLLAAGADRDKLKQRVVSLLSARFGRSSEKSSSEQLDLFAEALRIASGQGLDTPDGADASEDSAETEPAPLKSAAEIIEQTNAEIVAETAAKRQARKDARAELRKAALSETGTDGSSSPWPKHLPVREVTLDIPEANLHCDDCGVERQIIGYETSWRLEYTTTTEVAVTRIPVVACKSHHGGPLSEPVPPKPVDKGQLGFSLAAHILWLRITHNLPVRRIAEMMQSQGAPVSEQMIHTLISVTGERSRPVVDAIRNRVREAALVNIDDTWTDVHDKQEDSPKRKRRRARVWLALGDERYAYFFATRTWKAAEAKAKLGPIQGVMQGDGYAGFPGYAKEFSTTLAGCMGHLRRKIRVAFIAKDPRATWPMALVQGMYRVEKLARLRGLGFDARLALRQERSVPLMAELLKWLEEVAPTIVKNSPLGKAWTYLNNQQGPLQVFLHDGKVSIDNSAAERGLRRHTIGRKLWLFFRDQDKLEHVARLMSVLTTARLHGVDEHAYLTWLLEQLARREWSPAAAAQLLPEAWKATLEKQAE